MNAEDRPGFYIDRILIPDLTKTEILNAILDDIIEDRQVFVFALHISSLLNIRNHQYIDSFQLNQFTCIDGISIQLLLKSVNRRSAIERIPTTDFGHDLIQEIIKRQGNCNVALIGGSEGLSHEALKRLERLHGCRGVFAASGYLENWESTIIQLKASKPDIIFVGMGTPQETIWCYQHSHLLPNKAIVTCGGWFSFLIGAEKRAPKIFRQLGLEWSWRLAQSPRRLMRRYAFGFIQLIKYFTINRDQLRYVR